jgi:hypothetical protein
MMKKRRRRQRRRRRRGGGEVDSWYGWSRKAVVALV